VPARVDEKQQERWVAESLEESVTSRFVFSPFDFTPFDFTTSSDKKAVSGMEFAVTTKAMA